MVSLVLRRQVGSCEAILGRVFSSGSGRRHLLLVVAFSVRVIVGDHLVAVGVERPQGSCVPILLHCPGTVLVFVTGLQVFEM